MLSQASRSARTGGYPSSLAGHENATTVVASNEWDYLLEKATTVVKNSWDRMFDDDAPLASAKPTGRRVTGRRVGKGRRGGGGAKT